MTKKWPFLILIASLLSLPLLFISPIPQPEYYHNFADKRDFLGIPNAFDVLSNIPFIILGLIGMWISIHRGYLWFIFFLSVAMTGILSAYYHLNPNNFRLALERFPLSFLSITLFSIFLYKKWDKIEFIFPFFALIAITSVLIFLFKNDIRLYLLVQVLPFILLIVFLYLYPIKEKSIYFIYLALFLYVLSKICELFDRSLYDGLSLSGHTLKHLFSSIAVLLILIYAMRSTPKKVYNHLQ